MEKEKNLNIPNILSVIRICLIPLFVITYFSQRHITATAILLVSGITDVLDGFIARHFNLTTSLGKILDPFADKTTQIAIWVCLAIKFYYIPLMIPIACIFFLKELVMMIGGFKILKSRKPMASSRWFGKIGTLIFYCVTIFIIATTDIVSPTLVMALMIFSVAYMLFALVMYVPLYFKIKKM